MSLSQISVSVLRATRAVTLTGGRIPTETPIAGSPFLARVYRVPQSTVSRFETAPGTATQDQMRRMSIMDPTAGVRKNDIALIPSDDAPGTTERAKVVRVRRYDDRIQCDLETGVEP